MTLPRSSTASSAATPAASTKRSPSSSGALILVPAPTAALWIAESAVALAQPTATLHAVGPSSCLGGGPFKLAAAAADLCGHVADT
jgi:hypothetical protein